MTQDLVIYAIFIAYAVGMLMTFGTILTSGRAQAGGRMSDRIGANRAYVRIPFTQIKLIWWGLFHGLADGLKMLVKEDFKPRTLRLVCLRRGAMGRVHAGAAGVRRHPLRRAARPRAPVSRRWPNGSTAARCRSRSSTPGC